MEYTQSKMFKTSDAMNENAESRKDARQQLIRNAMAGDEEAYLQVKRKIYDFLQEDNIEIKGYTQKEAVEYIYGQIWGLGVVEKYYRDNSVDEIRVNGPDNIYIVRRGRSQRVPERFESSSNVEQVIKRMIIEDVGLALDRSSPRAESVRKRRDQG